MAEYQILQPFSQLGRPVFAPDSPDHWTEKSVAVGALLGLERRGWSKQEPWRTRGQEYFSGLKKPLSDGQEALLYFHPPVELGSNQGQCQITRVELPESAPAERSELISDLMLLVKATK